MKQEAPMLKTNGGINARDIYANDVGSLVIIAGRNYADRVPWGLVEVEQTILFAGVHKPGVAIPRPLSDESTDKMAKQAAEIERLTKQLEQLTLFFGTPKAVCD